MIWADVATVLVVDLVGKYESTAGVGSTPDSHGSITINGDVDVDEEADDDDNDVEPDDNDHFNGFDWEAFIDGTQLDNDSHKLGGDGVLDTQFDGACSGRNGDEQSYQSYNDGRNGKIWLP